MRPVLALAALSVLVVGTLAACSDDDPLRLSDGDRASFSLRPQLIQHGASAMLPINLIRLTVLSLPDSAEVMDPVEQSVSPTAPSWPMHLDVPLIGGNPIDVVVLVELINVTNGVRTVEWSGIAGPFSLEPGGETQAPAVELGRGSLENLSITAVFIEDDVDVTLTEGDVFTLHAFAQGATGTPQFFWSSLDPTIAVLDTARADSAVFQSLLPGAARLVVEAGIQADTLTVSFAPRITELAIDPAIDTLDALGQLAQFTAQALDARGDPVAAVTFEWASSDSLIARSMGDGSFRADGVGTVVVTATTPDAPGLEVTASLTVRQVVANVVLSEDSIAFDALDDFQCVTVSVTDAEGNPVATTVDFTTDDAGVATIDSERCIQAEGAGETFVIATADGVADSVHVAVSQTIASVEVAIASDTILPTTTTTVTGSAFDAGGDPVTTTFSWSSSVDSIASVDAAGVVTGGFAGDAWIRGMAGGIADSVRVTVLSGPPDTMYIAAGDNQSGAAGTTLGNRISIRIDDEFGNPVRGIAVSWSGDGTIAPVNPETNLGGRAPADWTLGTTAGVQTATATAGPLSVTFHATATADAVASVVVEPDSVLLTLPDETAALDATSLDQYGNDCGCTASWLSRDEGVATVDADGIVTAVANGTTWIVADVSGFQDSAFVEVAIGGRTITWTGVTSADWFDPSNWSASAVPSTLDQAVVPAGAPNSPVLDADADVAALTVEPGATLDVGGEGLLTIHGNAIAQGSITSTSGTVIVDGIALLEGSFPSLTLLADASLQGALTTTGNLVVSGGAFVPGGSAVSVGNDFIVNAAGSIELATGDDLTVTRRTLFAGDGNGSGSLTGGVIHAHDEFAATGSCSAFASTGTQVVLLADSANVTLECADGAFGGNYFDQLSLAGGVDQTIVFDSHIVADRFTAFAGGANVVLRSAGLSLIARVIEINEATIDGLQVKQQTTSNLDGLNLLDVVFTGFTGSAESQLIVSRPGDSPVFVSATFDDSSDGLYIEATDVDAVAPFLEIHVQSPSPDGPARTTELSGAVVRWPGEPYTLTAVDGDGQSGAEGQALADSLRVQVLDVFGAPAAAGSEIVWSIVNGGGSISPIVGAVDAGGFAAAEWTLGPAFTQQTARAAATDAINTADFEATSFSGAPGATITWLGTTSSDWHEPLNWSAGSVASVTDTAFIPAAAPNQPVVAAPATVAGLMIETGATVDVSATTLVVDGDMLADGPVTGTGTIRFTSTSEIRTTDLEATIELPAVEAAGSRATLWSRTLMTGGLTVLPGGYIENVLPWRVDGSVLVAGDDAMLFLFDSLSVGGDLQVGGAEVAGEAYFQNRTGVEIAGNVTVTGRGLVELTNSNALLRIGGDARWEGTLSAENLMAEGIVEVSGDWYQDGPSFWAEDLQTFFVGTGATQQVTTLNVGPLATQGRFGPVHVANPAGVTFLTPVYIRGDLTTDAGVPIVADSLVVDGDVVASGDVSAVAISLFDMSVSGTVTASSLTVRSQLLFAAGFDVDSTTYAVTFEDIVAGVNASLPYRTLAIEADSAAFDGPATISDRLRLNGHTRLGGRTTVGGQVFVENLGELILDGHTLDATGGAVSVGEATGSGIIPMTNATDSIIAEQVTFNGWSTQGLMTAGTIVTSGFTANGLSFNADTAHTVVLDARGGVVTNQITLTSPFLADGLGARFGTLVVGATAPAGLEINSDVPALNFVTSAADAPLLVAAPGAQHAILSVITAVDGATFRNVPVQVLADRHPLAIDNTTFESFDAATTQLEITHDATQPFVFTNMRFDSIAGGDPPAELYLRATKTGLIDDFLDLTIDAVNVTNGGARTITTGAVTVTWPNDRRLAPPPATIAWTGESSVDWTDEMNWTDERLPTGADTVHVFADAPFQPQLFEPDSIAGLILEPAASLTLNNTLTVFDHVVAGTTITGPGTLRMRGGSVSGTIPTLELGGTVATSGPVTIQGDLLYVEDNAALLALFPTNIDGSAYLDREGAHLLVGDVVNIAGAAEVGVAGAATIPEIDVSAALAVGLDLTVVDMGVVELSAPAAEVTVGGNASFLGTFPTSGFLTQGTMRVAGGFIVGNAGAFTSTGTLVVLQGAGTQTVSMAGAGQGATDSHFHDLLIDNASGVTLASDVHLTGDLDGFNNSSISGPHTLRVAGYVDVGGDVTVDSLQLGGAFLNVSGTLAAGTTEFFGAAQPLPAICCYQSVLVSGSATTAPAPIAIARHMTVSGALDLQSDVLVDSMLSVAGTIALGGHQLSVHDLSVVSFGLDMSDPADQLIVRGGTAGFFEPSASTFQAGTVTLEPGANFISQGAAFRSSGTALVMNGDTLFMDDPGPGAGQGQLASVTIGAPVLVLDSVYIAGNLVESAPVQLSDRGSADGGPWFADVRVAGDILTPNSGYFLSKIALSGDLQIDYNNMDVDSIEFFGDGQLIHTEDPVDFSSIPYGTILITGPNVALGGGVEYVDLAADVIVRGAGVTASLESNDDGTIGSLRMEQGDATTSVRFAGFGWEVQDSIVVETGVLDLADQVVDLNTSGAAANAFRTTGTGALRMLDAGSELYVWQGDVRFEGGSTDGLLTGGNIELADVNGTFYSVNDAFRSTGVSLFMHGDSIRMVNAGGAPGQGQLGALHYTATQLDVVDSLYISGPLTDGAGAMLHDATDDALVTVVGNATIDESQMVVDHFVISGDLIVGPSANWVVDTTTFIGSSQVAPVVMSNGFTPIPYNNVVFQGGGAIDFGTPLHFLDQGSAALHVRDPGTSVTIYSNDNGSIRSLWMQSGDASTTVALGGDIGVMDSVRVDAGVLDLNGFPLDVNTNGVVPNGMTVAGTGAIEMDQPTDNLDVIHGPARFVSGTPSVLSNGVIHFGGNFYSENDAFRATGTFAAFEGARLEMVNGGPDAGQGAFYFLEFQSDPTLAGDVYVFTNVFDNLDGTLDIASDPGTSLEVNGTIDLTGGSGVTLSRLVTHDELPGFQPFNVDVTEYAGAGLLVDSILRFDTLIVSGSATRDLQPFGGTDTIANVVFVVGGGAFALTGGNGNQMIIRDSLVVTGAGSLFDLNGGNLIVSNDASGALVTADGGVIVSQIFGYLSLDGSASFTGGSTEDRLTDGVFYFGGDFYAEGGAFQASGNHESYFTGARIDMPNGGRIDGADHFGDLTIASGGTALMESDVYVWGTLDDGGDPTTLVTGAGRTIVADGWQLTSGFIVSDVTLELDASLDPLVSRPAVVSGLVFDRYPSGGTRMRMRHPGLVGGGTIQFTDVDFSATEGDPGLLAHAIDTTTGDVLNILYYFQSVPEPNSFLSRTLEEGGANITMNTP